MSAHAHTGGMTRRRLLHAGALAGVAAGGGGGGGAAARGGGGGRGWGGGAGRWVFVFIQFGLDQNAGIMCVW
ncbi:hypothetical protein ABVD04_20155, partial [Xanthomonas euvesicatoria]